MIGAAKTPKRWIKLFRLWSRRVGLGRKMAFALAAAAVISGLATVVAMTQSSPSGPDPRTVLFLLYLDAILLLPLGAVVAWRLVTIWAERRRGLAGSGLHTRLVILFSAVSVTPAILVVVFSALFFNFGIQSWFSKRVRTALEASNAVATAYLHEHQQNIRSDLLAAANDLNRDAPTLMRNSRVFNQVLSAQAEVRNLPEALVVDSNGRVLARSRFSQSLEFDLVPRPVIAKANKGDVVVLTSEKDDRVRAVVKLNRFVDAFLIVGRFVDARVLEHIERTRGAVARYKRLEKKQEGIQITFVMIFVVVALLVLLAAVWIGLALATKLAHPISNLISAVERVRKGDLAARVDASASTDEIGALSRGFNRMTSQLETQQQGLMDANRLLDERRRFTETVLSGVSAGVIGLDGEGRIHLPNRSAMELLATDLEQSIGKDLSTVVPEMAALLEELKQRPERMRQAEIRLMREGQFRTLLVRMAAEQIGDDIIGFVVTFDDVTELLSAQRKAAWADIARRIAHEIKNPLTPIQLSAERLKRKYLKEIQSDPETFATCTETIVRHVEDIGRMVNEFSSFARMPNPRLKAENIKEICRQAVFFERTRHPEIEYIDNLPEADMQMRCDSRQLGQALTNLLKNAAESVKERQAPAGDALPPGRIQLILNETGGEDGKTVTIAVEDNGKGLPDELQGRLDEPYVTTRTGGAGLGLAIVKKIMEDHNGDLVFENLEQGGARVSLVFRSTEEPAAPDGAGETRTDERADLMKVATDIIAHGT